MYMYLAYSNIAVAASKVGIIIMYICSPLPPRGRQSKITKGEPASFDQSGRQRVNIVNQLLYVPVSYKNNFVYFAFLLHVL